MLVLSAFGNNANAFVAIQENLWKLSGDNVLPSYTNWELGSTGTRVAKGWFTDLDISNVFTLSGTAGTGGLNMNGEVIENIGNAGTDFTATGGLNLADDLGIGTTSPDTKLQVVGDTKFGDDNTNYISFASDGELSLTGTARIKKTSWIDAGALRAPGDKPATSVESGLACAWEFGNEVEANQEHVSGVWKIPADMEKSEGITMKLNWYANGISPGNCRWQLEYLWIALNEDETGSAQETLAVDSTASSTSNGMTNVEFTGIDTPASNDSGLFFKITRLSGHANDTISDSTYLRGRAIIYTSNKLGIGI